MQEAVKFAEGFPSKESLDALADLAENASEQNKAVLAVGYNKIARNNLSLAVVGTTKIETSIVENVQLTRTETRTRMVPVQRSRSETRTRTVPVIRTRMETRQKEVEVVDDTGEKVKVMKTYQVSVPYTEETTQAYTCLLYTSPSPRD